MQLAAFIPALALALAVQGQPAAANEPVRGPGFEISIAAPPSSQVNAAAELVLTLAPLDGRKLNQDYPVRITIAAPPDVALAKSKLGRGDARTFDTSGARFAIAATPKAAGDKALTFDVRFAVCTDTSCQPQRRTLTVALHVR